MVDVVKKPAGGPFAEWKTANFAMIREKIKDHPGGVGRGGVLKLAGDMWKQMSEGEKQPWEEKFKEHTAAYAAYKSSDAYVEPEKKKRKHRECYAPVDLRKYPGGLLGIFMYERHRELDAVFQKVAMKKFRALSDEEKAKYQKIYDGDELGRGSPDEAEKFEDHKEDDGSPDEAALFKDFFTWSDNENDHKDTKDQTSLVKKAPKPLVKPATSGTNPEAQAVFAQARKEGLGLKVMNLLARPEIAAKGFDAQKLLTALRDAGGKVPAAKRALLDM